MYFFFTRQPKMKTICCLLVKPIPFYSTLLCSYLRQNQELHMDFNHMPFVRTLKRISHAQYRDFFPRRFKHVHCLISLHCNRTTKLNWDTTTCFFRQRAIQTVTGVVGKNYNLLDVLSTGGLHWRLLLFFMIYCDTELVFTSGNGSIRYTINLTRFCVLLRFFQTGVYCSHQNEDESLSKTLTTHLLEKNFRRVTQWQIKLFWNLQKISYPPAQQFLLPWLPFFLTGQFFSFLSFFFRWDLLCF